jgi:hypothetical protein
MLHTAVATLPLKSAQNRCDGLNPHKAIVLPKPHRV